MMTELEERLAHPSGTPLRNELLARLGALEQRLRQRISEGLSRKDYDTCQACAEAAVAALQIVAHWPAPPSSPKTP